MTRSLSRTEILTSAEECFAPSLGAEAECHKILNVEIDKKKMLDQSVGFDSCLQHIKMLKIERVR